MKDKSISICVYGHTKHPRVADAFHGIATHTIGSFELVYVEEPGTQPENVNRALSRASGRYVCLHDNDAMPLQRDWLGSLVSTLEKDATIGLVGPIQIQNARILDQWRHEGLSLVKSQFHQDLVDAMNIPTMVIVFDRERTPNLSFDEAYPGQINGSDVDFCLQVHYLGFRVVLDTRVIHLHPEKVAAEDILYDRGLASMEDLRRQCEEQGKRVRSKWFSDSAFAERMRILDGIGPPEAHLCGPECHAVRFGQTQAPGARDFGEEVRAER